jgi:hypothetical protein
MVDRSWGLVAKLNHCRLNQLMTQFTIGSKSPR